MLTPPALTDSALRDFFRSYRDVREANRKSLPFAEVKGGLDRLRSELEPLQAAAREREAIEVRDFNIFRILRLSRKEVITHSPMLANLLNPSGTHGQGPLFLNLFLDRLTLAGVTGLPSVHAKQRWFIQTEQVTDFGNLDISLSSPIARTKIVIENKIGAADQKSQLRRYRDSLDESVGQYDVRCLVYLTPSGHPSAEADSDGVEYVRLSYREDIAALLEAAIKQIRSPKLNSVLLQYLELVPTL